MKKQLLASLVFAISTGAYAQAPVVDVSQQANPSVTSSTSSNLVATQSLEERLAVLERIVDSRTESQQRMQRQLDLLQDDVDSIRGSIELHNHQLEQILERQRELYLRLENSLTSMQQQSQQVSDQISTTTGQTSQPTVAVTAGSEQSAYQDAVNLILQQKDYDAAIPAFQSFLSQYPGSQYTDNAHYWLGQLLYNKQQLSEAANQFQQVVDNFAKSPKRADSILKLGMIALRNGDTRKARSLFDQVIAEYPSSTPAKMANDQLTNL
ncbi:tol-pal system protein YbgF [Glaciecola sp. 1036]|uniref:tol-pal system protein YbgF n=1 Tax=Alteromonadaceae TaxID=72275 RepID=UPI003D025CAD